METGFREWSRDKIPSEILAFARSMRKEPTEAEQLLWDRLRNRKLHDLKFRRQQHIEGFILDFYCDQVKLGVEVDGEIHASEKQKLYDQFRTEYLAEFGIHIIRFPNEEVLKDPYEVARKIGAVAKSRFGMNPSPLPLSPGRGVSEERGRGEGEFARGGNEGLNSELKYFRFTSLLQTNGWLSPAYVGVDQKGIINYLSDVAPDGVATESVLGYTLPGFQNAHSHAFQYAMAGLAENHPAGTDDDFWTWREAMYQSALSVDPDQAEAIAAMLYAEMVRVGYAHVAEFHYLHHDKDGKPYSNPAEMGERMVAAAKFAGIKITLIPVFYQKGGFGLDAQPRQRRFISKSVDEYFKLFEASKKVVQNHEHASLGFSVHSLRAVDLSDIKTVFHQGPKDLPFHLHVAEQKKEVADCLAYCNQRSIQWLLENLPVSERFHLVHSTHLDDEELKRLAASNANVVLCPSTEGNLGDGIFRMKEYAKLEGHWSIGTDSHIGLNPLEEFRMIDYRQRLVTNKRNTFEGDAASYMINESTISGRKAMGVFFKNHFAVGQPFDAVVYNAQSHLFSETSEKNRLATILYTSDSSRVLGTIVNGKWVVKNQHHGNGHKIKTAFSVSMAQLKNR